MQTRPFVFFFAVVLAVGHSAQSAPPITLSAPLSAPLSSSPYNSSADNGNLLLGNPTNARNGDGSDSLNFLVERPQHSMSYNANKGTANWVSWHTDRGDLGKVKRGTFAPDLLLPPAWQIRPNDYTGSGYDRGHVCPSGDRTDTKENNAATFVMSNMMPQTAALNQHLWKSLEDECRDLVRDGNELYTVAGGLKTKGTIARGKVNIPATCWKIVVVLPRGDNDLSRINAQTRVIAVAMPNDDTPAVEAAKWRQCTVTVAQIEKAKRAAIISLRRWRHKCGLYWSKS